MELEPQIKRILVVDDDTGHREMTCKLLEEILNYSCIPASSAFEALEILQGSEFDLVLSDIIMEGKDGLELVSEAREKYPNTPCIIMTGYSSEYSYTDIIAAGADDFISKPFGVGELKAKLDRVSRERGLISRLEKVNVELKQAYHDLAARLEETIHALVSAMELRDPYTAGHQARVADIACLIAKKLNMPEDSIYNLRLACLVHDIGKISIPSEILTKPAKLTDLEMSIIMTHVEAGYDILKEIQFNSPIAQIVLQHHERQNGSGYPNKLFDKDILQESQILAVADVMEAMSSHRPYRAALGVQAALDEISRNRGTLFNPEVVDACMKLTPAEFEKPAALN